MTEEGRYHQFTLIKAAVEDAVQLCLCCSTQTRSQHPGTPLMAASVILLGKQRFDLLCCLLQAAELQRQLQRRADEVDYTHGNVKGEDIYINLLPFHFNNLTIQNNEFDFHSFRYGASLRQFAVSLKAPLSCSARNVTIRENPSQPCEAF